MLISFMIDSDQVCSFSSGMSAGVASVHIAEIEFPAEMTLRECFDKVADFIEGLEVYPYRFYESKAGNVPAAKVALQEAVANIRKCEAERLSFSRNIDRYNICITVLKINKPYYPNYGD